MHVLYISAARPIEVIEPCNPSPCGINAECTERGTAASCACIRDYIGNPYIECKPECVVNPECPRDKACVNQHCVDPCPGVCGAHATCYVTNHVPLCRCDPGFTGDAFVSCRRITTRKFLFWVCLARSCVHLKSRRFDKYVDAKSECNHKTYYKYR